MLKNIITVVGSLNIDLVISTPRIPKIGETIIGKGFMINPGGKGANQAVACAKLNGNVYMIGCVGDDIFGKDVLSNLKKNNVKIDGINIVKGVSTGVAVIILKDGDNFIILDSGANFRITPEDVEKNKHIIEKSFLLISQLEIPLEVVEKAFNIARKNGVKTLLNPAPAKKLSDKFLSKADIIILNETECELLTGVTIKTIDDAKEGVKFLMNKKIEQVIITLGEKGVVYNDKNEIKHKKAFPVNNVVDTTAAGDSFIGAFAVALSKNRNINEALDFAVVSSAITVTRKGAQSSLPTLKEVKKIKNFSWI